MNPRVKRGGFLKLKFRDWIMFPFLHIHHWGRDFEARWFMLKLIQMPWILILRQRRRTRTIAKRWPERYGEGGEGEGQGKGRERGRRERRKGTRKRREKRRRISTNAVPWAPTMHNLLCGVLTSFSLGGIAPPQSQKGQPCLSQTITCGILGPGWSHLRWIMETISEPFTQILLRDRRHSGSTGWVNCLLRGTWPASTAELRQESRAPWSRLRSLPRLKVAKDICGCLCSHPYDLATQFKTLLAANGKKKFLFKVIYNYKN